MPNVSVWRRLGLAAAVGLWTLALVSSVGAQVPREEPRIALVIGNSAYHESPLRNPVNDVRAMAQRLKELGFTVLAHENATKRTMEAAIIEFGRRLSEGGVGAFYYAGHGLQFRGRNYLVPVDAEFEDEASTRVAAVDVELLLEQMAEAKNRVTSSLTGDLVVNPTVNVTTAPRPAPTASVSAPPPAPDREGLFWMSIKDGTDPAAFEAYLKQYPQGTFAVLARQRLASVSQPTQARDLARFDGVWNVTVQCPAHGSAAAYTKHLLAQVKDGAVTARQGEVGQPNSLALSGKIQPDGKASIDARGMVGDPRNAVRGLSQGTAYAYRVDAVFEGTRGVGNRAERRPPV